MTISTTASRISYNGNGVTTVFSFPYRFLTNGDVVVVELSALGVETVKTLTTDYTLTGAGDDAGGSVTMIVAPASGAKLTIYRNTGVTQEVDYISGDPFPAETHERALDRLTMIAQETNTTLSRTLKIPVTSDADTEITFNAGEFLAINQDGDAIITTPGAPDASVPVSTFMETLLDDTTAAAARTTLGAGATGSTLFTAANAAAGRSTLSAAQSGAVTASGLTMSTARVLMRTTAGTGAIEEGTAAALAAFIAAATEGAQGAVELASSAETVTGTDLTRATHPAGTKAALDARLSSTTPSTTGTAAIGTATTFARADHNHAQGAPTSAQVGTANAGLAYGAVGTYFRSSGGGGTWTGNTASGATNAINTLSGTWRNMTDSTETAGAGASLALRIA